MQQHKDRGQGTSKFAFRSVSYRMVNDNPRSRENTMRAILERMFGKPFPKARPAFLKDPALGQRWPLELDAFCPELNLAAEFNGKQHSEFPNPFHTTIAQFQRQQKRDAIKLQLCRREGVRLLVVPHTVAREDIKSYLLKLLNCDADQDASVQDSSHAGDSDGTDVLTQTLSTLSLAASVSCVNSAAGDPDPTAALPAAVASTIVESPITSPADSI